MIDGAVAGRGIADAGTLLPLARWAMQDRVPQQTSVTPVIWSDATQRSATRHHR
jgi:hypothetical protein